MPLGACRVRQAYSLGERVNCVWEDDTGAGEPFPAKVTAVGHALKGARGK
jgi:hypothetical protein